jgi:DNA topoisomerase-1
LSKKILVITEKPSSAKRIADALDETNQPKTMQKNNVTYYCANRNGNALLIVSAIGHLYTISQRGKEWNYPVFEYEWLPIHLVDKSRKKAKLYIDTIKTLADDIDNYVSACDYDLEGSLIAYNILRYAVGKSSLIKSKRMRYSTLTKQELQNSWDNLNNNLDYPEIQAGKTRHEVDWLYGINLSRALTRSIRNILGFHKILSVGRVQGPTLSFIKDKEKEIQSFVPLTYWKIFAETKIDNEKYSLEYEKSRLEREIEARNLAKKCRGKIGKVINIERITEKSLPPYPFNLSDLQRETFKYFKINPKETLSIAENLYLSAYISYPRTNSQQIPETINIKDILDKLSKNEAYSEKVNKLQKLDKLIPRQGLKKDPAHPAIHPTGETPKRIKGNYQKIYDIIVKRFLSSISSPAESSRTLVEINVEGFRFYLKGNETINLGWMEFYEPYIKIKEKILPKIEKNMNIPITNLRTRRNYTNPPRRYNESSLIRYMENQNIGTKATRTNIIDTLYKRDYIKGKSIKLSKLGFVITETLEQFCKDIVSVQMTRVLEEKLEKIQLGKLNSEKVIEETKEELKPILKTFKFNKEEIGAKIAKTIIDIEEKEKYLGQCPSCDKGKIFIVNNPRTGKIFASCNNYKKGKCDQTYGLPQDRKVHPTGESCAVCGAPIIKIYFKNKPWMLCINNDCPKKKER